VATSPGTRRTVPPVSIDSLAGALTTAAPVIDAATAMAKCVCLNFLGSQDPQCLQSLPCDVTPQCSHSVSKLTQCMLEDEKDACADFTGFLESERGPWGDTAQRNCRDALLEQYKAYAESGCTKPAAQVCVDRCESCWNCKSVEGCKDTRGLVCSDSCSPSSYCSKFSHC
jgi:hypothetical protein